jgi:hypothetical protein
MVDISEYTPAQIARSVVDTAIGAIRTTDSAAADVLIDEGATYTYIGKALPGTLSSTPSWRLFRITNSTGVLRHADGVASYSKVWDDRAGYTYG